MSEQSPEASDGNTTPPSEPLTFDAPNFDYVEKSGDQDGIETKESSPDESK